LNQLTTSTKFFKTLVVFAACWITIGQVQAQESKIAIFDSRRVMAESAPAKAAEAKIEQEFSKRDKELRDMAASLKSEAEKLDKDGPILKESERIARQRKLADMDQDWQRKNRTFREDLSQRKNEEIAVVTDKIIKAIKQIAETEKYDVVLQDAVYYNPRIDITDKVLKALAK
jgi:outer membrane protein